MLREGGVYFLPKRIKTKIQTVNLCLIKYTTNTKSYLSSSLRPASASI